MPSSTLEFRNMDIVSGGLSTSTLFFDYWKEKTHDSTIEIQTASFADPLLLFLQNEKCNIIDKDEVLVFLNNNIGMMDYLYQVPSVLREKFGNVSLDLSLLIDPEEESDGTLFLEVKTGLTTKESLKRLDEFIIKWLLPNVGKNITKFNVDILQK